MKAKILIDLYNQYQNFRETPLYIEGAQSIVFGEGDPESPIIFIGEAPGREEDIERKPFVGRSGKLLTKVLRELGFERKSLFFTNIVKCRPPNNRIPTKKEIETGRTLILDHELDIIEPKLIVTFGISAFKGLLGYTGCLFEMRGKVIKSSYGDVFPMFHPSYILSNKSKEGMFKDDIKEALKYAFLMSSLNK